MKNNIKTKRFYFNFVNVYYTNSNNNIKNIYSYIIIKSFLNRYFMILFYNRLLTV